MNNQNNFDIAILGGGPAGMSAALICGRVGLRTLVVNTEAPRNIVTTASHGFLTRDGAHPSELLEVAKSQLEKYATVRYVRGRVREVRSPVTALASEEGVLRTVELKGGETVERDCGFVTGDFSEPATRFAEALGVAETTNDWGMKVNVADDSGKTNVPGVYVVGDARSGFGGLLAAAGEGAAAAEAIAHEIAATRWESMVSAEAGKD